MTSHDHHTHRILTELEASDGISQRSLSRSLGIALGLTNLLIRKVVRKGWVRIIHVHPNRVRYLLTPAGIAEKARMSRRILQDNVRFYAEARDRIRERFANLSSHWQADEHDAGRPPADKRIVFFGTGEIAEIGYICLQGTDLQLIGVVDDRDLDRFFTVPVYPSSRLGATTIDGQPFGRLVVMTFGDTREVRGQLDALKIPAERVFWM